MDTKTQTWMDVFDELSWNIRETSELADVAFLLMGAFPNDSAEQNAFSFMTRRLKAIAEKEDELIVTLAAIHRRATQENQANGAS